MTPLERIQTLAAAGNPPPTPPCSAELANILGELGRVAMSDSQTSIGGGGGGHNNHNNVNRSLRRNRFSFNGRKPSFSWLSSTSSINSTAPVKGLWFIFIWNKYPLTNDKVFYIFTKPGKLKKRKVMTPAGYLVLGVVWFIQHVLTCCPSFFCFGDDKVVFFSLKKKEEFFRIGGRKNIIRNWWATSLRELVVPVLVIYISSPFESSSTHIFRLSICWQSLHYLIQDKPHPT